MRERDSLVLIVPHPRSVSCLHCYAASCSRPRAEVDSSRVAKSSPAESADARASSHLSRVEACMSCSASRRCFVRLIGQCRPRSRPLALVVCATSALLARRSALQERFGCTMPGCCCTRVSSRQGISQLMLLAGGVLKQRPEYAVASRLALLVPGCFEGCVETRFQSKHAITARAPQRSHRPWVPRRCSFSSLPRHLVACKECPLQQKRCRPRRRRSAVTFTAAAPCLAAATDPVARLGSPTTPREATRDDKRSKTSSELRRRYGGPLVRSHPRLDRPPLPLSRRLRQLRRSALSLQRRRRARRSGPRKTRT